MSFSGHLDRVSTNRTRELWTDRTSGDAFVVELEDGRVLAADGPVDPARFDEIARAWTAPTDGRAPAFTSLATELDRRREEFERRSLAPP
jgi:hypothetical protein